MKFTLVRFNEVNKDGTIYPSNIDITFPKEGVPVTLDGEIIGKIYEACAVRTKDMIEWDSCSLTYQAQKERERIFERMLGIS